MLPPVASGSNLFIDYRARFETPGAYDIKYTLSVPGDTAPGNDSLARPIVIRPHYDIATRRRVETLFADDLREFGYRFEDAPADQAS